MKTRILIILITIITINSVSAQVKRKCLLEIFDGIQDPHQKEFHHWYDPWLIRNEANLQNGKIISVAYRAGDINTWDSLLNTEMLDRQHEYKISAIPTICISGRKSGYNKYDSTKLFNHYKEICIDDTLPSNFKISGEYVIYNDSFTYDITIKAFKDDNRAHRVFVISSENHIKGVGLYYKENLNICRKFLPSSKGTFTTGGIKSTTPFNIKGSYKYTTAIPVRYSSNYNSGPYNSKLIVFIQDTASYNVMQAEAISPKWPNSIHKITNNITQVQLYPNPTSSNINIALPSNILDANYLEINITDVVGRKIKSIIIQERKRSHTIDVSNLAQGTYYMTTICGSKTYINRFIISK